MNQDKVKTVGTYKEMAEATNLDHETIAGAIEVVEQTAHLDVEVPEEKKAE